ncbi:hypothetical protein QC762_0075570 [Podospora pseudocomata]|uniref:Uncharacterized protein n=1 Tax=Podospora pseudocomata TaxID=2093779 RepID=A0ABR0GAL8_9PEZI|nr:hypothetical protein QC762_0075570 [Podospora pseudocomata]
MAPNSKKPDPDSTDENILISHDQLYKIDQLRARNIGKYLPLPQLVDSDAFISVSIIPGPRASVEHKEVVESYSRYLNDTAQLQAEFPAILDEDQVNACMGIRTPRNPTGQYTFSEDVLKLRSAAPTETTSPSLMSWHLPHHDGGHHHGK